MVDTPSEAAEDGSEPEVKLTVIEPKPQPTPVGVGAESGPAESEEESGSAPADSPDALSEGQ
jgi:hypothetical protein